MYQRIEQLIGKQLPLYKTEDDEVMVLQERVAEAQRMAKMVRYIIIVPITENVQVRSKKYHVMNFLFIFQEMKDLSEKKGGKRKRGGGDDDDTEEATGVVKRLKKGGKKGNKTGRRK